MIQNNLSNVKVETVFEIRGYSRTTRQIDSYYRSNRGQNNSILVVKEGIDLVDVKQISGGSINNEVRKKNPANSYGKGTCCGICESICHWAKECLIKNQAHITTPKLPFLLRTHRNVLQKTFLGKR